MKHFIIFPVVLVVSVCLAFFGCETRTPTDDNGNSGGDTDTDTDVDVDSDTDTDTDTDSDTDSDTDTDIDTDVDTDSDSDSDSDADEACREGGGQCYEKIPGPDPCPTGTRETSIPCDDLGMICCVPISDNECMDIGGQCLEYLIQPFQCPPGTKEGDYSCGEGGLTCCIPEDWTCVYPADCADEVWNVYCQGHWDCEDHECEPICDMCGAPQVEDCCGDGYCDTDKGETWSSCGVDCTNDKDEPGDPGRSES